MDPPSDGRLDRAVTSPIGIVIILGITLTAAVGIVVFGAAAFESSQSDTRIGQAELAMTQFDSRAAQVALGSSSGKTVTLGEGDYTVDESAGTVNITHIEYNQEDNQTLLKTTELGAVIYEHDGTTIAYQGGGVWRQDGDGVPQMVSPPEFHYRDRTLTFPIVTVVGTANRAGDTSARISRGSTTDVFPRDEDYDDGSPMANPTANGSVLVTIESEYCAGWQSFFESRSDGGIEEGCDQGDQNVVVVDLTVPFEEAFTSTITYTEPGGLNCNPSDNCPDNERSSRPSISDTIDQHIAELDDDCSGNCKELDDDFDGTLDEEWNYADGDLTLGNVDFDTSGGHVHLVVDGELTFDGNVDVDGEEEVRIMLRGGYDIDGDMEINKHGNASQFQVYVHSSVEEVSHDGTSYFRGIGYMPETYFVQNGNGEINGTIVAKEITDNGASSEWNYDESLEDFQTDIIGGGDPITFLHVTENEVEVDLE